MSGHGDILIEYRLAAYQRAVLEMTGKKLSAEQLEKLRSVITEFKKDFR